MNNNINKKEKKEKKDQVCENWEREKKRFARAKQTKGPIKRDGIV